MAIKMLTAPIKFSVLEILSYWKLPAARAACTHGTYVGSFFSCLRNFISDEWVCFVNMQTVTPFFCIFSLLADMGVERCEESRRSRSTCVYCHND